MLETQSGPSWTMYGAGTGWKWPENGPKLAIWMTSSLRYRSDTMWVGGGGGVKDLHTCVVRTLYMDGPLLKFPLKLIWG